MKKIQCIFAFILLIQSSSLFSQGLQGIVVEKYYLSDAADQTNSIAQGAIVPLAVGSTTYRVYVDLVAGYKFNSLFGSSAHNLTVNSTTNFFNDPNQGVTVNPGTISVTNVRKNTVMLDSYFTTGGTANGKVGVLKSEDTDGTIGNQQNILANNAGGCVGLPINGVNGQDGMLPSSATTYIVPNSLGLGAALDVLDQTAGNSIVINGGTIAALGGVFGATSSNMVLVAQFTTNGTLTFALNLQIQNVSTGLAENYVSSNPVGAELTHPTLTLLPNVAPVVGITSPSNGASIGTGATVTFSANATDTNNGTITSVQFFLDNALFGTDNTSPYELPYIAMGGAHTLYAIATDSDCVNTTSSTINFTVSNNQAPTVSITAPASAVVGALVTFTAAANDPDGTVAQVEFFVNNISVGIDFTMPYSINYTTTLGSGQIVRAVATDNLGLTGNSNNVIMNVLANVPPAILLTSPLVGSSFIAPAIITISANASDTDGTITQVEFFVNSISVGVDATSPYSITWTSTSGIGVFTAIATDNNGALSTSSSVTLEVADPNALPYAVGTVTQTCDLPTYCIPISVSVTNPIDNVIGLDITLNYDPTHLTPTGNITVYDNLVNSSFVETAAFISTPGVLNIVLNFNGSANGFTEFQGSGDIFCVEFTRLAAFEPVDASAISVSSLQESYITGLESRPASAGSAVSTVSSSYQGTLQFWLDNSPIQYDVALPNSFLITNIFGVTGTTINNLDSPINPNLSGEFTHDLTNGISLSIERDINNINPVQLLINAADAVLAKTLLLNQAFTPSIYQILSLDVNLDGVVSAGDVSQMKQRATSAIGEFQQAWNYDDTGVSNGQPSKDWTFVDEARIIADPDYQISTTFPLDDLVGYSKGRVPIVPFYIAAAVSNYTTNNTTCPNIGTDNYKGILIGDVDGSYADYVADGILKTNESDYIVVDINSAVFEGDTVHVPVSFVSSEPVNAFDVALGLDETRLGFTKTENLQLNSGSESFFNTNDKTLRYSAFNLNFFSANQKTVMLTFVTTDGTISRKDFTNDLGLLNGKRTEIKFQQSAVQQSNVISVYPNPSNGMFKITSELDGFFDILDITGKIVQSDSIVKAKHTFDVNLGALRSGIYFVRFYSENTIETKRITITK